MLNYSKLIKEKTIIKPKNILEIGSRDGDDANILKNIFNILDKDVWLVEPNPLQQFKIKNKYPYFNLINEAIFNEEKKILFNAVNSPDYDGTSSLLNRKDDLYSKIDSNKIMVQTITGKNLLKKIDSEIDLCKIDVEGLTYEVLESFGLDINKIKSLHIESEHIEIWENQKLYENVKSFLEKNDFIEIYFNYVNGVKIQSDSIWIQKNYIIKNDE
jgi:FkbM family methyltransferase